MNNNTCLAFQHTDLKNAYRAILEQMLRSHNVKTVLCTNDKEHYFDKINVAKDGSLKVWDGGFEYNTLLFDYTCDYARCLSYIEDAIYQQRHGINMEHGIIVEFAN